MYLRQATAAFLIGQCFADGILHARTPFLKSESLNMLVALLRQRNAYVCRLMYANT